MKKPKRLWLILLGLGVMFFPFSLFGDSNPPFSEERLHPLQKVVLLASYPTFKDDAPALNLYVENRETTSIRPLLLNVLAYDEKNQLLKRFMAVLNQGKTVRSREILNFKAPLPGFYSHHQYHHLEYHFYTLK